MQSIGQSRGGRNTKIHSVAANDRPAMSFMLSAGNDRDAPQGRILPENTDLPVWINILTDKAYGDDTTMKLVSGKGLVAVVPPKSNRKNPWDCDRDEYKKRNEVERLFCRLKRFGRVFTRYGKTDIMYVAFIEIALIYDAVICVNTP